MVRDPEEQEAPKCLKTQMSSDMVSPLKGFPLPQAEVNLENTVWTH